MTVSHTSADALLADAIWWFKGFRAAQPADASDPTDDLGNSLLRVREWLDRLPLGLIKLRGTSDAHIEASGQGVDEPLGTISAGGTHAAEVRAFLIKYYGNEQDGHGLGNPLGTVTVQDRFGLVTVTIGGEEYVIVDIGMRMLTPRELFNAQGFPPDYVIEHDAEALRMHEANHPGTVHIRNNIWQVDPLDVTRGRPVDLAWFSPDCKHFSKAKGGKPREKSIRDLAWVVVHWVKRLQDAAKRSGAVWEAYDRAVLDCLEAARVALAKVPQ